MTKAKTMRCSDSEKTYTDLRFSDIHNEQTTCAECGFRFTFRLTPAQAQKGEVTVPSHPIPEALFELRKLTEKASRSEKRPAK